MTNLIITSSTFNKNQHISSFSVFWKHENLGQEIAESFYRKFEEKQKERIFSTPKSQKHSVENPKQLSIK